VGHVKGPKTSHVPFVHAQKLTAGREVVIHDVEHLAIDAGLQSGECNRIGTVVNISERDSVGTAEMQKYTECIDAYPAGDSLVSGAIDVSGPDNNIRNSELLTVLSHDFVLFGFCEAVGAALKLGMCFYLALFIQQRPLWLLRVAINGKRTDVDESPQALMP
jgi:hypothetical protein